MRNPLLVSLVLAFVAPLPAVAAPDVDPKENWKLPKVEGEKWTTRVRRLLPRRGWTATLRGNDIVIQRDQRVKFAAYLPNAAPNADPYRFEGTYRITLQFGRKISQDQFESWVEENNANRRTRDKLARGLADIFHKFDDYVPSNDEEKSRVQKYREEVKKLVWHDLPDLYTPDHSIRVVQSWHWVDSVDDEAVAAECKQVKQALLQFFGVYDTTVAKRGWGFFPYDDSARK